LQGSTGTDGSQGLQGSTGTDGATGPQGLQGPTGPKTAIIKTDNYGYRELYCVEAPEVLFIDVADVDIQNSSHTFDISPIFIEACEKDSIRVMGYSCERPTPLGITIENNKICVSIYSHYPTKATITLCGVRKDFKGWRFRERSAEDAHKNNEFWNVI
jgi:hypothetical protein